MPPVPPLATPPTATLAEKDERTILVSVPKTTSPPPRPLPARVTPAPPVATLLLMFDRSITRESRPVAKMAPPSPMLPENPAVSAAPPVARLKPKELSLMTSVPATATIAPPWAPAGRPPVASAPRAVHSCRTLSTSVSDPLRRKMQPPPPGNGVGPKKLPETRPFSIQRRAKVTSGASFAVPISNRRNSGVPKAESRMIKLVSAGSGLVMRRSSVMTGKPFTPLLGAVSVTAPVTMVSWPALPATQPPTAALVFALVIASTSEQLAPVTMVAALAAPTAAAAHPQAKARARTSLVPVIVAPLPHDERERRRPLSANPLTRALRTDQPADHGPF